MIIAVIEWKLLDDRIAYAKFHGKFYNISVISVYVRTLCADDNDKDKINDKDSSIYGTISDNLGRNGVMIIKFEKLDPL